MHTFQSNKIKDNSKGQKIVAAIYLVTNHVPENEPLKKEVRARALLFLTARSESLTHEARALTRLLETALLCQYISDKNASLISYEIQKFVEQEMGGDTLSGTFFTQSSVPLSLPHTSRGGYKGHSNVLYTKKETFSSQALKSENGIISHNKKKRQDQIMSFMKEKKSATLKDILVLFPGISDKTIQREVTALVFLGLLSKRGDKRWSVYLLAH